MYQCVRILDNTVCGNSRNTVRTSDCIDGGAKVFHVVEERLRLVLAAGKESLQCPDLFFNILLGQRIQEVGDFLGDV